MKRVIRLALVASAAVVTLAFTGSAWASYSPSLTVTASSNKPGAATSLLLGHIQSAADDPTAKDTIYVAARLRRQPLADGRERRSATSARELILRAAGNTTSRSRRRTATSSPTIPANYTANDAVHGQATARGRLAASNINVAGTSAAPSRSTSTQSRRPREQPSRRRRSSSAWPGRSGRHAGAQLEFAFFDVNGVFTNPASTSDRIWRATFTPYVAGTPHAEPGRNDRGAGGHSRTSRPHDGDEEPQAWRRDRLRAGCSVDGQALGRRSSSSTSRTAPSESARPGPRPTASTRSASRSRRRRVCSHRCSSSAIFRPVLRRDYPVCRRAARRDRSRSSPSRSRTARRKK